MCLDASLEEEVLVCGDLRGNLSIYARDHEKLQFTGMKQVKELSMVQAVSYSSMLHNDLGSGNYALGFASAEFIIWNLITEAKVVQIPCGGWRRPNSYFLGDVPELRDCFAYVKDEIIYIHRHWVPDCERKIYPQNLHLQFHGREMHSLCFISENTRIPSDGDEDDEDEENGEDLVDSDDVEAAADGDEAAT
ncbi:hypothetical protein POM88_016049 [Heracleum sosnowskyi]|uniref:Uncharacterized protein n=1 Tax=Heracleum sosnowskyi TaxID=360622 RepID=A0AAD8MWF7_9APIA|nr:hypothetical protein POM88_016049 [Heracleum sosnowskyi]